MHTKPNGSNSLFVTCLISQDEQRNCLVFEFDSMYVLMELICILLELAKTFLNRKCEIPSVVVHHSNQNLGRTPF